MTTQADAEASLKLWATRRREVDLSRNRIVVEALAAGITKHRVHILSGIARTTIDEIIENTTGELRKQVENETTQSKEQDQ